MAKDVIIACDFPTRERTLAFLDMFGTERPYVKIGMELFYAEGPDIVREIKARGHSIFLDLKLCDIPNTVKRAMAVLRGTGADMINLHAFGTREMMTAALEGLTGPDGTRPLLIAVTQLTSTSEERMRRELLIDRPVGLSNILDGELVRRGPVKRSHREVVRAAVMDSELLGEVIEGVETVTGVKALLVLPVAALHLAVVARRI